MKTVVLLGGIALLSTWAAAVPAAEEVARDTRPEEAVSVTLVPGQLSSASTFHSIGIEWSITGDGDYDALGTLEYRVQGSSAWSAALAPVRVVYGGKDMLAGSILFLTPGMSYEVRVTIADPDGGSDARTIPVATRAIPVPPAGGRMLHVVPGAGGGSGSSADPFRGLAAAWTQALPGDVLLLHAGAYGAVRDINGASGAAGNPIVIRAYGDGEVVLESVELFRRSHLWFEGLTFRRAGGSDTAFFACLTNAGYDTGFQSMIADVNDVVLLRNRFEGFKHSIRAGPRTSGWYVADNVIVGDKQLGISGTESFDGEGIELAHGDNHVVAHNSITRVADGVSFPNHNCDIFGNDIFDVTDDGIELDHGRANTRAWGNRIHNAGHNGIAFQPMAEAPWYIVRNQIINYQESAFKFRETDRFVALHNTFVNWGDVLDHWSDHLLRGITRNNLWISVNNGKIWRRGYESAGWRTDLDYDGFDWGNNSAPFVYEGVSYASLTSLTQATGLLPHGLRIQAASCFETLNVPGPPPLTTIPPQHVTLNAACPAVDAGQHLANVSDGFTGSAPDLGANERGRPLPLYGPRNPVAETPPAPPANLRVSGSP